MYIVGFITAICYFTLGFFFDRSQFSLLLFLYSVLFLSYLFLIKYDNKTTTIFALGVSFRIVLLFATPFLSQDFYRFIWDGRLIALGINPYEFLPNTIIDNLANFSQASFLHQKMGDLSASHYSNYPPFNQLIFAIAAFVSGKSIFGSIIFFKIIIILADIGIYHFGKKLLLHSNQNPNNIYLYFLNPLVIIELTGNLHFEGVMLFLLILGLYFLTKNNWILAAFFIAISISTKLLPLLILPIFFQQFEFKKAIAFYSIILLFFALLFVPFLSNNLLHNYLDTISLWFVNFEFNASIYYLLRAVGFYFKGYNTIAFIGQIIPVIAVLIVLFYAFVRKNISLENVICNSLLALTFYFFLSTTVHPWYIINLVLLSVFTKYRYAILWSFLVILSYFAYSATPFKENYTLLFLEYSLVFSYFIVELNGKLNFLKMDKIKSDF